MTPSDGKIDIHLARLYHVRASLALDTQRVLDQSVAAVSMYLDAQEAGFDLDDDLLSKFAEANRYLGQAYEVLDELGPRLHNELQPHYEPRSHDHEH